MTSLQLWLLALLIGMIFLFSMMRVKKEQYGALVFFDITVIINGNKKLLLAYAIIDTAIIVLYTITGLSLLPNWFYALCLLSNLVICRKGLLQPFCYLFEAYVDERREKRKIKDH